MKIDWPILIFNLAIFGGIAVIIIGIPTANNTFEYEYDNCLVKVEIVKTWGEPDRTIVDEFCRE